MNLANINYSEKQVAKLLTALATVPNSPLWLKAQDYRRKIGLGQTQFQLLKNKGKFNGGTDPATLGSKHIRIHAWWNYNLQAFVVPYMNLNTTKPKMEIKHGKA